MSGILLQLALDVEDMSTALKAAVRSAGAVDIVEDGTVLCLSEGLESARLLRAVLPSKPILTDVRIARAGGKFARMCFQAGADRVSVVGESGLTVVKDACKVASQFGGGVEVELFPGWKDEDVRGYIDAGVQAIIVHRNTCTDDENKDVRRQLHRLHGLVAGSGISVTLAGGLNASTIGLFRGCPFDIAVVGSAIALAEDPLNAACEIHAAIDGMT